MELGFLISTAGFTWFVATASALCMILATYVHELYFSRTSSNFLRICQELPEAVQVTVIVNTLALASKLFSDGSLLCVLLLSFESTPLLKADLKWLWVATDRR